MPTVKSCCCCSLESGSQLLGFLNLVIDTLASSVGFYTAFKAARVAVTDEERKVVIEELSLQFYTLVEVALGIYLLCGIYQRKLHYIRAWVVIQIAFLAVSIFSDVTLVVAYFLEFKTEIDKLIGFNFFITVFHAYSILIVHSYEVSLRMSQPLNLRGNQPLYP